MHIEGAASTMAERQALAVLGDGALKHQFVVGVRVEWVRHDLRVLMLRSADRPVIVVRGGGAMCLMYANEARVKQMRPVEKAAPALSGPVGGSVSYVLGLDDVVLGDGGLSSGAVSGRCYNFKKANRETFTTTLDNGITSLASPSWKTYTSFSDLVRVCARKCIPRGCRIKYISYQA